MVTEPKFKEKIISLLLKKAIIKPKWLPNITRRPIPLLNEIFLFCFVLLSIVLMYELFGVMMVETI